MPVRQPELAAYNAEAYSFQRERHRWVQRINWLFGSVAAVSLAINIGLVAAVLMMVPLVRLVPVFLWTHPDGTIDSEASISALPATQTDAIARAYAWAYVRHREGYSFATAQYSWDLVRLMSSEPVNRAYQNWFRFTNPDSPQVTVGQRGQIDVYKINIAFIRPKVIQVRYYRIVRMYDAAEPPPLPMCAAPVCSTWTATVEFDFVDRIPARERDENPAGFRAVRYQISEGA